MPSPESSEDSLLRKIRQNFARTLMPGSSSVRVGIGDDAAIFSPRGGYQTILTCDWFLEGTHFLREKHPPDSVGWKCLARALSDVAAMGATPGCFLLSLALPTTHTGRWLEDFLGGLRRSSRRFSCELAGGDTTRRSEILIEVMVVGEIAAGRAVLRSGAQPGDTLYVSGKLGEAELGLRLLRKANRLVGKKNGALRKHLYPQPRLALGRWLAEKRLASAMMDLSDGLSSDLPRLCSSSGVGARVQAALLPAVRVSAAERRGGLAPLQLALHGGDDYELLFTVAKRKVKLLPHSFEGVPLTAIGEVTHDRSLILISEQGRQSTLRAGGWDPFRNPAEKNSGRRSS